jgi:hypothetical protein
LIFESAGRGDPIAGLLLSLAIILVTAKLGSAPVFAGVAPAGRGRAAGDGARMLFFPGMAVRSHRAGLIAPPALKWSFERFDRRRRTEAAALAEATNLSPDRQ